MADIDNSEDIKRAEAAKTMRKSLPKLILGIILIAIAWYLYHTAH